MPTTVTSPDRNIRATLRGRSDVHLEFRSRCFAQYSEMDLAGQLTRLVNALTRQCRAQRQFTSASPGNSPRLAAAAPHLRAARDDIQVRGRSLDGRILLDCVGLHTWRVHVARGTIATLTEQEFAAQAQWAVKNLWWQYRKELKTVYTQHRVLTH